MWPTAHLIMFFGMLGIHLLLMPPVMVNSLADVEFGTLSQVYLGIFMSSLMVALEGLMHPMPLWAWAVVVVICIGSIVAYKQQWFVTDTQYLREMIPHHSMALVTSEGRLQDPRSAPAVRTLAREIIDTQDREIKIMRKLLQSHSQSKTFLT
jgi:hypothetical protein